MRSILICLLAAAALPAQTDWPMYGHDPGATRYSPLKQVDVSNVARLQRAWTFHSGKPGGEGIPVVINGVMYATFPNGVFALQPETGKELWHFDAEKVALRGLGYWPGDRNTHPRLYVGTGSHLAAIDAVTGKAAVGFGREGLADLKQGVLGDLPDAIMGLQSPPVIFKDLVITGSVPNEGKPTKGAYGDIRAWNARTGKLVWSFHTVPRPGEPGVETWGPDGWKNRSGTNAWGFLTIDMERGLVFVPTGSPTSDFYGADRPGKGLYGNSLIALDAATGKMKWYQQLVHHDLWDYDAAAPPILLEAAGKPAVAQITKMGLMFIFDRRTGDPIFGMEERPVPKSRIPGEESWPTQPFPVKPPPLAKNTFQVEDIYDLTPEHAAFCKELYEKNHMFTEGPYTPMPLEGNALLFPSTLGGGNWGGFSYDPRLGYAFTNIMNVGQWGHMEKKGDTYVRTSPFGAYARFWDPQTRQPCTKPPYGELVAVNLKTGDIAWRAPIGLNLGGSMTTAGGLVFIAATNDATFRAFESKTGKLLWEQPLDGNGHTYPITYQGRNGKQYIAIMAGGGGGYFGGAPSDSLIAFAVDASEPVQSTAALRPAKPTVAPAAQAFVEKTCGTMCHDMKTVTNKRRTRAQWSAIVENMIVRGAMATPDQGEAIAEYLSLTYF